MAKKSKTQRAKASARRAEKKERAAAAVEAADSIEEQPAQEEKKGGKLFSRKDRSAEESKPAKAESNKNADDAKKKPKKERFKFLKDVRAELRRVTWPTRQDVLRWSGVVVVALVFFSLYVFVLDNWIVTPLLLAISSLGA